MSVYHSHEWLPIPGTQTGTYTGGPRKLILHTTEGGLAGSLAAYRTKHVVPHFTWDFTQRKRLQHVDTARSVSALANDTGGVQTNRDSAIQVEIVGFAAQSPGWPDPMLQWLADGIKEICDREGIDAHAHPRFVGEAERPAGEGAAQRMSPAQWDAFNGVCGHQHVPENEHWDPGGLHYDTIERFMEDDMTEAELRTELKTGESRKLIKGIAQGAILDGLREPDDAHADRGVLREPFKALLREVLAEREG